MLARTKRRLIVALFILAGIPVFVCFCVTIVAFMFLDSSFSSYLYTTTFDSQGWKSKAIDSDVMWPTRLRMVDDLIQRRLLDGRSREQVEDLLGPADKNISGYFREWDLVYHLGPERSFIRIDSEWLVIRVDVDGKVTEYQLMRD